MEEEGWLEKAQAESCTGRGLRPVNAKGEPREDREEAVGAPGWASSKRGDRGECTDAPLLTQCYIPTSMVQTGNALS